MFKNIILASILAVSSITSSFAAMVHINQADASTFAENLKGVGMAKAKAIVKYRKENGDFNTVDELTNVKGIGAKTVEKNRKDLTVKVADTGSAETDR